MDTAITNEPPPAAPAELFPQLIYTLDRWDYLAWWMCQWDRTHPEGPPTLASRLMAWIFWVPLLLLGPGAMVGLVAVCVSGRDPNLRTLSLFAAMAVFGLWLFAARRSRAGRLWRALARDNHLQGMRDRALDEQLSGRGINSDRIFWFLTFADGFQEASELRRLSPQGIDYYEFKVTGGPWTLVRDVVVAEQHVYLVGPGEEGWIIPKRCFADAKTLADFLDTVHHCRRASTLARVRAIVPVVEHSEGLQVSEARR
jgi:hypothetical protein